MCGVDVIYKDSPASAHGASAAESCAVKSWFGFSGLATRVTRAAGVRDLGNMVRQGPSGNEQEHQTNVVGGGAERTGRRNHQ